MSLNTLEDVYHDQLQDIWSANKQALDVLTELGEAAKDEGLSKALIAGSNGISEGLDKIAEICGKHGIDPNGEHCKGMEGLVAEAKAHVLNADFGNDDARDAMIITQYQRMVHYALAGYGCLVAFANRLDLDDDGAALQNCLNNTYDGDKTMTSIATGGVNAKAKAA
ncbi:ferritin-like metal-binding protein YciE [Pacificibacter maritimus]|uniref:Ferritin-like metal-binding protein YciE n=1 Tax=Pacificibacter maritimus TaxID=762213 RepID=A0A3N4UUU1_9RHOB|nr:ferritin-like domain-containing protein [Pacificibacter maritimus]RPE71259.1 ferritin-like metal-binding protein YciE [Pacificibacter maritimus]